MKQFTVKDNEAGQRFDKLLLKYLIELQRASYIKCFEKRTLF